MGWQKAGLLACLLLSGLLGCSTFLGKNPLTSLPGSSGKLAKTPEVLVLRGQAPEVCAPADSTLVLSYFVHLKWMPPQALWVESPGKEEVQLFGKEFTIRVRAKVVGGGAYAATTRFRTAEQKFEVTTVVFSCASAANTLSSRDTASGSAEVVVGI